MDRISDSGSDGCGSIPHGGTKGGDNYLIVRNYLRLRYVIRNIPWGELPGLSGATGRRICQWWAI